MSVRMQVPLSQRRHTNVAVVRYARKGIRLEIACYKNKVISYRSGTEDRLDEVLQVDRIFSNVARGHVAPEKDIQAVFGPNMSSEDAIKHILIHGELQVAQHERTAEVSEMSKDIALIISQKCINTNTQRPFPYFVIEQALNKIGVGVKLDQPVKKQALSLIHQLVESQVIPIARADMKLRCSTKSADAIEMLKAWCNAHNAQIVEEVVRPALVGMESTTDVSGGGETYSLLVVMQPSLFAAIEGFVKAELPSGSTVHVVEASVLAVGEGDGASFRAPAKPLSSTNSTACSGFDMDLKRNGNPTSTKSLDSGSNGFQKGNTSKGGKPKRHQKGGKGAKVQRGKGVVADDAPEAEDRLVPMPGVPCEKGTKGSSSKPNLNESEVVVNCQMKKSSGAFSHAEDGEESDVDPCDDPRAGNMEAAKDALVVQLQRLGLDPVADLTVNDKDDVVRNKRNKNANKRKPNKSNGNASSKKNVSLAEQDEKIDSDEELEGNRKQRKKNSTKKKSDNDMEGVFDEEIFDYDNES